MQAWGPAENRKRSSSGPGGGVEATPVASMAGTAAACQRRARAPLPLGSADDALGGSSPNTAAAMTSAPQRRHSVTKVQVRLQSASSERGRPASQQEDRGSCHALARAEAPEPAPAAPATAVTSDRVESSEKSRPSDRQGQQAGVVASPAAGGESKQRAPNSSPKVVTPPTSGKYLWMFGADSLNRVEHRLYEAGVDVRGGAWVLGLKPAGEEPQGPARHGRRQDKLCAFVLLKPLAAALLVKIIAATHVHLHHMSKARSGHGVQVFD